MNYITNRIVELVTLREPEASGETMILINGFENLSVYNQIARLITYTYKLRPLSVDIKLAGKNGYLCERIVIQPRFNQCFRITGLQKLKV